MKKVCLMLAALLTAVTSATATPLTENFSFSTDPLQNGWQEFGDTNLFEWYSTNEVLDVTWDSTQTNSYFCIPLGTVLTSRDDFALSFDLLLTDATATNYGSELTIGFLNLAEATNADFQHTTGFNSPDLVEFDYFPATVTSDATVWPLFVDSNSIFNWNNASDYAIFQLNLGDWYHVVMTYTASNQTMVTTMTNFEDTTGITIIDALNLTDINTNFGYTIPFSDFSVDTLSITSYEDDGYGDSIYAQGLVSNITVTLPPPVRNLSGAFSNGVWLAQFSTQSNWLYTLQRTCNFQCWTNIGPAGTGNGTPMCLPDASPPADKAYYRVLATSP